MTIKINWIAKRYDWLIEDNLKLICIPGKKILNDNNLSTEQTNTHMILPGAR